MNRIFIAQHRVRLDSRLGILEIAGKDHKIHMLKLIKDERKNLKHEIE